MDLPKYHFNETKNDSSGSQPMLIIEADEKTQRLMELIENALDVWAKEYHLERVPKRIIFEQAIDIMHVIEEKLKLSTFKSSSGNREENR